jgi:hypothetical protein
MQTEKFGEEMEVVVSKKAKRIIKDLKTLNTIFDASVP